ncbi:uncharacterized protein B0H18DRAFT_1018313 [Fomitopsis serialis]|uniref:uncharacterized protein n=1 Tax=Fomitopsis serialis TaxID=139415 RepID=UPI002007AD2C|nr:uncharacterized protein B0H18DRAFT_1018313 [Neoantrodia serialis]KAH9922427.1 hypothetical protein B0H18DRAFT_1018313 [Neoantrodia serialis]
MPDSATEYFHTVVPFTPYALRRHLLALPHETLNAVDALLRFVLDAPCPPTAAHDVRAAWDTAQHEAAWRIVQLRKSHPQPVPPANLKRTRDDASPGPAPSAAAAASSSSKRAKTDSSPSTAVSSSSTTPAANADADDPPVLTLHALSLSSPIRKKADITVHRHSLRLTSGPLDARTPEAPPIPLAALRRAFLLPTRGKARPHWTVLFMPSDVPVAPGKAGAEARGRERAGEQAPSVAFGVDAVPAAALSTSTYAEDGSARTVAARKGEPAEPALRAFLSHFHTPPIEPSTDVFRSAAGEGVAGVEAYRGAKPGTLWFLSEGVLWDGRPAEFFALHDVAPADGDDGEEAVEGVRTISATGRTCTVVVRRVERTDGEGDEEDRVVEVDFAMVDGKEQEGIARWVRRHRHLFGRRDAPPRPSGSGQAGPSTSTGAVAAGDEDEEDEDDEDFVASESDDGSATSESDSDGEGAESVEDAEASDADTEDGEEGGLDPAHHPLLRPGAMPKRMSRAAMEMVVGMVEKDLVGVAGGGDEEDELAE